MLQRRPRCSSSVSTLTRLSQGGWNILYLQKFSSFGIIIKKDWTKRTDMEGKAVHSTLKDLGKIPHFPVFFPSGEHPSLDIQFPRFFSSNQILLDMDSNKRRPLPNKWDYPYILHIVRLSVGDFKIITI